MVVCGNGVFLLNGIVCGVCGIGVFLLCVVVIGG